MVRIAICDDNIKITSYIEKLIFGIKNKYNMEIEVEVFFDGLTLLSQIEKESSYDIIYLDVEMKIMNGIDTAYKLREIDKNSLLIYVTSHEKYAKELFEVSAFRFLTKPINEMIFEKYFFDAINKIVEKPYYFTYKYNKVFYKEPLKGIIYFESDKRVSYIEKSNGEKVKCYLKLNNIEKHLKDRGIHFFRVHQSYLVNPRYIYKYKYDSIVLDNGIELSISEKRRKAISEMYCKIRGDDLIGTEIN